MSAANLETLLARLYTDAPFREAFLADAERVARAHGLDETEVTALRRIDRAGLEFACRSFAHKRAAHAGHARSWFARLLSHVKARAFSPLL